MTQSTSSEGVYFLSLSVENVRCFAGKQTLDLSDGNGRPARWVVILGDNGTGKTTLLEILGNIRSQFPEHNLARTNSLQTTIVVRIALGEGLENANVEFYGFDYEQKLTLELDSNGRPKKSFSHYKPLGGEFYISPIYLYSASRRLEKKHQVDFGGGDVELPVDDEDNLINAEEWLLQTDYIANKPSEIQASYLHRLEIIKETLIALLPDVTDIRITEPSERSPNPRVEFKMPDGWLLLSQLSLGYQTMTAWMVDLAAQLFKHYHNSPNPIAEPAVVLIDEIDLHLHPKWQRTIMSYMSQRFINTQFIVTAHSPLIVQAAENANIVVLKREGNAVTIRQESQDVQGWRIDQLLTSDLFDLKSARSPHYEKLLEQRRQILGKPSLDADDEAKLATLESQIGDLPTAETHEDIDAMDIIRRAAELLK